MEKGGVQPLLGHGDPPVPCSDTKALTSVYIPHKYACFFFFLTPVACTIEGTDPQRPPQVSVQPRTVGSPGQALPFLFLPATPRVSGPFSGASAQGTRLASLLFLWVIILGGSIALTGA